MSFFVFLEKGDFVEFKIDYKKMKIVIAGDFCPCDRVVDLLKRGQYEFIFGKVRPIVESSDYAIVNLECPVVSGNYEPIEKLGPNLKCEPNAVKAIKYVGFNMVTLANNHILDYGKEGLLETVATCTKEGIDTVGVGNNLNEASQFFYKEIIGKKVGIINCCEHEFSIATDSSTGANPLNPIQQFYQIKEARKKVDYLLVIVHGGHEHFQLPSPRMVEIYHFL